MRIFIFLTLLLLSFGSYSQCPNNLSFDANNLSFWSYYPGYYVGSSIGNYTYTNFNTPPAKVTKTSALYDYHNNSTYGNGIEVYKTNPDGSSPMDEFKATLRKVPLINGYDYGNSIRLGNSKTNYGADKASYVVTIPTGVTTYNITYAYALVLQDGSHTSTQQPRFNATIIDKSTGNIINCASKQYNYGDVQAYSLISAGLYYIDWKEVSFDLSQYAGKQIEIRFEAFDCSQGGHFGYAYLAIRNDGCGSGIISGNNTVCNTSTSLVYSTASVSGANYSWTLPYGWTGTSTTNTITVNPNGNSGGNITVTPSQSCGNITTRSLAVNTVSSSPSNPGAITGDQNVCVNSANLTYSVGSVSGASSYNWSYPIGWTIVSGLNTNSITFNANANSGTISVTAVNLCGNSSASTTAIAITNSPLSLAGTISGAPGSIQCPTSVNLTLGTSTGSVQYWQSSINGGVNWTQISNNTSSLAVSPTSSTLYKATVKNGSVCASDDSDPVLIQVYSPINIYTQPIDINTCAGAAKTFSIAAEGDGTLSYQWQVLKNSNDTWSNISSSYPSTGYGK